ncbi:universal stress protein [Corynebacterium uberis]|uniref:universal stress protein n=1 Tax=Corynebacterium TaxID=1716 RepID=UPI001D09F7B3|nr:MULTISPECIES: universal stress protein [Corynebacterium]MCZ9309149.1 universal stress protein [Corynebacterium sp. c6VSa_13]UDL76777.1 universal stress protein [Corynebacterium uberis]UDL78990.1 universal stress protein [Corynebacterium uberis]UDL81267.1 universal stress protein [Corynebacterium uberis]UDL85613.1 universal stress protein [Corynebacterium uberis]
MITYNTIAAGTDGSDTALIAVRHAASLARVYEAKLVLICAHYEASGDVLNSPGTESVQVPVVSDTLADRYLEEAKQAAVEEGAGTVEVVKVEGAPVTALSSAAKEAGAELLVLGNRGIHSLAGRIFGNIPTGVARKSTMDVMIVNTEGRV